MMAFTKSTELVAVEIVTDNSADAAAVEEMVGGIAVAEASEAMIVGIEAADGVGLEAADLLVSVDQTKHKLLCSDQYGGFHHRQVFILKGTS